MMTENVRVRVVTTLSEVEEIRSLWTSWQRHPNVDIDFYLTMLQLRPEMLHPYIIIVYRGGSPEAMLIGRVHDQRVEFKVGYKVLFAPKMHLLNFVYGGALGNFSSDNSEIVIRQIWQGLRHGIADMAMFEPLRTDSSIYRWARRIPGVLSRDLFPARQPHWSMTLPRSINEVYSRLSGKTRRQLRWEAKKLLSDYPGSVTVFSVDGVGELERMIQDVEEIARKTYQRGLSVGFIDNDETRRRLYFEAVKGWLRAHILYVADKPCAFWIGQLYQDVFYLAFIGYDPSFGSYSPGTFLTMKAIEDLCNLGVNELDFGLGDAAYKRRFGNCNWMEAPVFIWAPTLKAWGFNIIRTLVTLLVESMKKALERTTLLRRVKRVWRTRVTQNVNG